MFEKFTKGAIKVIMLCQEQHVLPAMTLRRCGARPNLCAAVRVDTFYS